jgi:hypothetical protein
MSIDAIQNINNISSAVNNHHSLITFSINTLESGPIFLAIINHYFTGIACIFPIPMVKEHTPEYCHKLLSASEVCYISQRKHPRCQQQRTIAAGTLVVGKLQLPKATSLTNNADFLLPILPAFYSLLT